MEETKRDFLGEELNVGDEVVFITMGYRSLTKGFISKMTPMKCTITHEPTPSRPRTKSMQFYTQVVKVGGAKSIRDNVCVNTKCNFSENDECVRVDLMKECIYRQKH